MSFKLNKKERTTFSNLSVLRDSQVFFEKCVIVDLEPYCYKQDAACWLMSYLRYQHFFLQISNYSSSDRTVGSDGNDLIFV